MPTAHLTPEQERVAAHTSGHALVFATAGSGKTTTVTQRARRLCAAGQRPGRILMTTFSRAARDDIARRLDAYPECSGIRVSTIHSLATMVINAAVRSRMIDVRIGSDNFATSLFFDVRRAMVTESEGDPGQISELQAISHEDFMTYLGVQKAALRLPVMPQGLSGEDAALVQPPDGRAIYRELYRRHDAARLQAGLLDFDDMIVTAWVTLRSEPALLTHVQGLWDHVIVDEYQDVNLGMNELVAAVAGRASSLMAIGDDDQTIYQWRGSHPRFILDFARRHGAATYPLPENFRCPLGVVALANRIISANTQRTHKSLHAARGGLGIKVHREGSGADVAIRSVAAGTNPEDIVILVRHYAQTAPIEQGLLEANVPYRVVGARPFHLRTEVTTLLAYLRLAAAEATLQGGGELPGSARAELQIDWQAVASRPTRYLRAMDIETIGRAAWNTAQRQSAPLGLSGALRQAAARARFPSAGTRLTDLASALTRLAGGLDDPRGVDILEHFVSAIDYRGHLIKTAPTPEIGTERAGMVTALMDLARGRSLSELQRHLAELAERVKYEDQLRREHGDVPRITLMTAFRAKGLEWPVVILPDCERHVWKVADSADVAAREEERRIFYVAVTRAQETLHLITAGDQTTAFLQDAGYLDLIAEHERLVTHLASDPAQWTADVTLEVARTIAAHGHHAHVMRHLAPGRAQAILARLSALHTRLAAHPWADHYRSELAPLELAPFGAYGDIEVTPGPLEFSGLKVLIETLQRRHSPHLKMPALPGAPAGPASGGHAPSAPDALSAWGRGTVVKHPRFGRGEIISRRGQGAETAVTVEFDSGSKKTLLLRLSGLQAG